MTDFASDSITEAIAHLRNTARELTEAKIDATGTFEKVQLGRARDAVKAALVTATDARNILRDGGR